MAGRPCGTAGLTVRSVFDITRYTTPLNIIKRGTANEKVEKQRLNINNSIECDCQLGACSEGILNKILFM